MQSIEEINGVKFSWTLGRALLYASAEQGSNSSGIQAKISENSDNLGHFLYGDDQARPLFDPTSKEITHKGGDNDDDNDNDWDDLLEHHSNRLWGSLLFLLILVVVLYLLLGKVRRRIIWQSVKTRIQNFAGGRHGSENKYRAMRHGGVTVAAGNSEDEPIEDLELGVIEDGVDAFSVSSGDEDENTSSRSRS